MKKRKLPNPNQKQPVYWFFKRIFRLYFRRPEIINLAGDIEKRSIIVSNHAAKSGPPAIDAFFPIPSAKWGAYQMLGNFKSRREYMRDVLYTKKLGKKLTPWISFKSSVAAIFSPMVYKGLRVMPSYPDTRFFGQLRDSAEVLNSGLAVMIYPENSNDGYKDVLTEFYTGFVLLSQYYYKKYGEDLPIYPVHYCIKKRIMVIGKPMYVQEMIKEGLNRYQIADKYCQAVNQLYFDYIQNK